MTASSLAVGSTSIPVTDASAYRTDNIFIFDTRVEKQFLFKDRYKVGLFFDAFNINNSNANQTQDATSGIRTLVKGDPSTNYSRFMSPTSVVPPGSSVLERKFSF